MRDARPVDEAEVVLAFLAGEIDSRRFGPAIRAALADEGTDRTLIDEPDLDDQGQNEMRLAVLCASRGWGTNNGLFAGFPTDVAWQHGRLEPAEVERTRFINYSYWIELSGGSRRPQDVRPHLVSGEVVDWVRQLGTDSCFALAELIRNSTPMPDIIVVGTRQLDQLVVLDGHARLTGLFVGGMERSVQVRAYLGTSNNIQDWKLF